MPTTKTISAVVHESVRTDDTGGKYLVSLVTYSDASQERLVFPIETTVPV